MDLFILKIIFVLFTYAYAGFAVGKVAGVGFGWLIRDKQVLMAFLVIALGIPAVTFALAYVEHFRPWQMLLAFAGGSLLGWYQHRSAGKKENKG